MTISVPYTADGGKGNVKVYCTDNGKMEDMNAALSDGILSWTTSHFSTFEVVAYDGLPRLHTRLRKMEPPLSLPVPLVMP